MDYEEQIKPLRISNRYEILHPIGKGGMGAVYAVLDHLTGRTVALKRVNLLGTAGDSVTAPNSVDTRLALAQEFKVLASLRHPNIISVLDYGFDESLQPYFTMDWLQDADDILQAGRGQPLSKQLDFLVQILQALAYLHRRNVLHRDLKPANVLVKDGQVKLLDFGLASARDYISPSSEYLVGTPAYMSPEVLSGQAQSEASDLYAVGMIAYEMITGEYPYQSNNMIYGILTEIPDSGALEAVHPLLASVVMQLLSKQAEDRQYDSNMLLQLYAQATGQPIQYESASIRESYLQAARFVGRERELNTLRTALARSLSGQGSVWLVGGESGVGKSRLLEEIRTQALVDGALVLRGQAISEGGTPYLPWREPLRRLCLNTDLSPREASVLKALIPDIASLVGYDVPDAPQLDPQPAQDRLLAVIDDLFDRQEQPIVLILEDLHWAGSENLNVLKRVHPQNQALLIIASYRDDEAPHLPRQLPGVDTLKLERFKRDEIAVLASSMLGSTAEPIVGLLERETEGNPFFIVEVVRELSKNAGQLDKVVEMPLPDRVFTGGIDRVVSRRLSNIPPTARPLLYAAAVAGRMLDLDMLSVLAGENFNLDLWLATCADYSILDVEDNRWRFAHDKLRDGLLAELTVEARRDLHRQVAEALESMERDAPQQTASLAYHWGRAENPTKEYHYNALAGEQSLENAAYKEAAAFLERAIALSKINNIDTLQLGVLERQLGLAYWGAGDMQASRDHLERALILFGRGLPKRTSLDLVTQMSEQILRRARLVRSRSVEAGVQRDKLLQAARAYHTFGRIYYMANESMLSFNATLMMLNLSERIGVSPELAQSYANMSIAMGLVRLDLLGETYVRLAIETAEQVRQPSVLGLVYLGTGLYRASMGQWQQARVLIDKATFYAEQVGDKSMLSENLAVLVHVLYFTGDIDGAFQLGDRIYNIAYQTNNILHQGWGLSHKVVGYQYWGDFDSVFALTEPALDMLLYSPNLVTKIKIHGLLATTRLRQGLYAEAVEHADPLLALLQRTQPTSIATYEGHIGAAEVYLHLWEKEGAQWSAKAKAACTAVRQFARVFPFGQARAFLYDGLYQWLCGNQEAAFKSWQKSLSAAEQFSMPFEAALAHYEWGRHLSLSNPLRTSHLSTAERVFKRLGAAHHLTLIQEAQVAERHR